MFAGGVAMSLLCDYRIMANGRYTLGLVESQRVSDKTHWRRQDFSTWVKEGGGGGGVKIRVSQCHFLLIKI